jgi:hypothetical protein
MSDAYVKTFFNFIKDTQQQTGYTFPEEVEAYMVFLLADRTTKNNLIPDPSFAEKYLQLYNTNNFEEIKQFADDCLFFTSFMPMWGKRRGLGMDYYASLGISSYYAYSDLTQKLFYTQLGNWFHTLRDFLELAMHRSPSALEDLIYLSNSGSRTAKNKLISDKDIG